MRVRNHLLVIISVFILALGIAFSVKSDLGTSPISSVPYVLSLGLYLTIGEFTIIFNALLLLLQIIILKRDFDIVQLLQLPLCILLGYFIDFHVFLLNSITYTNYFQQFILLILGCFIVAFGVFLSVKANSLILPGDGLIRVISQIVNRDFGKLKPIFDISVFSLSVVISLILFSSVVGVREGTIISAVFTGFIIQFYEKIMGNRIDKIFNQDIS